MTNERLEELLGAKRSLMETVYGSDPQSGEPQCITGLEIEQMARELVAMRERNRRIAIAILSGNHRVIYREYARQWERDDVSRYE